MTLLATSAYPFVWYPFVWGCSTKEKTGLITTSRHSFHTCGYTNWVSLSKMRHRGTPTLHIIFFQKDFITLFPVITTTGCTSIHFVIWWFDDFPLSLLAEISMFLESLTCVAHALYNWLILIKSLPDNFGPWECAQTQKKSNSWL